MAQKVILAFIAIASMIPSILSWLGSRTERTGVHWVALAAALVGVLANVGLYVTGPWTSDLSTTLWTTIASTLLVFTVLSFYMAQIWRLLPLLAAYLTVLGIFATVWLGAAPQPLSDAGMAGWIMVHIVVSVLTYALATLAALAAFAAFLQDRALKRKAPNPYVRALPSVADCERIEVRLLLMAEIVLTLGLATGMATLYGATGNLLVVDHKTVLSVAAFLLIGGLLIGHYRYGFRGRAAARGVLLGYLLLTLAYPGVKFVTDILLV